MDIKKVLLEGQGQEEVQDVIGVDPIGIDESEEIDLYMQMTPQCAGNFVN